jgi:hypothetical protein
MISGITFRFESAKPLKHIGNFCRLSLIQVSPQIKIPYIHIQGI